MTTTKQTPSPRGGGVGVAPTLTLGIDNIFLDPTYTGQLRATHSLRKAVGKYQRKHVPSDMTPILYQISGFVGMEPFNLCSFLAFFVEWYLSIHEWDGPRPPSPFTMYLNGNIECSVSRRRQGINHVYTLQWIKTRNEERNVSTHYVECPTNDLERNTECVQKFGEVIYYVCRQLGLASEYGTLGFFQKRQPRHRSLVQRQHLHVKELSTYDIKDIFFSSALMRYPAFARYYQGLVGPHGNFDQRNRPWTKEDVEHIEQNMIHNRQRIKSYRKFGKRVEPLRTYFGPFFEQLDHDIEEIQQKSPQRGGFQQYERQRRTSQLQHLFRKTFPHLSQQRFETQQHAKNSLRQHLLQFWKLVKTHPRLSNVFPKKYLQEEDVEQKLIRRYPLRPFTVRHDPQRQHLYILFPTPDVEPAPQVDVDLLIPGRPRPWSMRHDQWV